jgi:AcrR family transcriptional regulator
VRSVPDGSDAEWHPGTVPGVNETATAHASRTGAAGRPRSLRERKKDASRQAIEEAAWELFAEKGFDATTVSEIADRANVAPRTFFRYFPSKEAVLFPEIDETLEGLAAAFRARPADEPELISLIEAISATAEDLSNDRQRQQDRLHMLKQGGSSTGTEFIMARVTAAVEQMVRERNPQASDISLRAQLAAGIASVVMTVARERWLTEGTAKDMEADAEYCFELVRSMMVPSPAGKRRSRTRTT